MKLHGTSHPDNERRRHLQLRVIYDEARGHIDHLFHHRQEWAGSSIDFLAHRVIHEHYPHLRGDDVRTLVSAIERVNQDHPDAGKRG
jgi:hypothetical protein